VDAEQVSSSASSEAEAEAKDKTVGVAVFVGEVWRLVVVVAVVGVRSGMCRHDLDAKDEPPVAAAWGSIDGAAQPPGEGMVCEQRERRSAAGARRGLVTTTALRTSY
jgi:hypothetical protein